MSGKKVDRYDIFSSWFTRSRSVCDDCQMPVCTRVEAAHNFCQEILVCKLHDRVILSLCFTRAFF